MKVYCYKLPPIDFWEGAMTTEDLLSTARLSSGGIGGLAGYLASVDLFVKAAERGFRQLRWEGDVREGPFYFALPWDTHMAPGYMLKQDNDGTTFVACLVELAYLDEIAFGRTVIEP